MAVVRKVTGEMVTRGVGVRWKSIAMFLGGLRMVLDMAMGEERGIEIEIETRTGKVIGIGTGIETERRMRGDDIRILTGTFPAVHLVVVVGKRKKAGVAGGVMGLGREIGREIGTGVGVRSPGRGDMSSLLQSGVVEGYQHMRWERKVK